MNRSKKSSPFKLILLILAILGLCFVLLLAGAIMLLRMKDDRNQTISEPEPEPTEPHFLFDDPEQGQIWVPLPDGMQPCSHDRSKTVFRNDLCYYIEEGAITSTIGIDVSAHQEDIDWQQVKEAGIDFAIIRCGVRTYGSGKLAEDDYYRQNMQGALEAGLDVGIYFYSQAITVEEAREEAEMVLELASGYDFTYPIVYDWEVIDYDDARTDGLPAETVTACTQTFCNIIREAGYPVLFYQNAETILGRYDLTGIGGYDLWLADYGHASGYYYDYRIWQYTDKGHIPGIRGEVDLNLCYRPYT